MKGLCILVAGLALGGCLTVTPARGTSPTKAAATATATATPAPAETPAPANSGGSVEAAIDGPVAPQPIVTIVGGSTR